METDYASQIVVDEVISEDPRFLERAAVSIEEEFPPGSRAFFLGDFNYGRPLEVVSHADNKAEIWLSIIKGKETEFGHDMVANSHNLSRYSPSYAVSKMLGLHPLVLSKITSAFSVSALGLPRLNLGLNLKFESKKLKVLGYSRKSDKGWEFSDKAVALLSEYMVKFPEFIAGIQRKPQGNEYDESDFYPPDVAAVKIKEIGAWLKTTGSKDFEKVPLDAEQLDSDTVMAIEKAADYAMAHGPGLEFRKLKGVPRNALMKPADAEHRLGNQKFTLGDRVVYVQDSGRVPIATRGTVVGISRTPRTTLLDVIFDVTFMSGTTLGDRCTPFRGSTVPVSSVLNLTNKQVIAGSKAAVEKRPAPSSTPLTVNGGYGSSTSGGQYREAGQPAPLRGSFRGAVSGHQNGYVRGHGNSNGFARGRGRGGNTNRNGPVFMPDTAAPPVLNGSSIAIRGNSQGQMGGQGGRGGFAATSYGFNAVPPPASLDARGRGGRGRGRGRGGAPRGRGAHVNGNGPAL